MIEVIETIETKNYLAEIVTDDVGCNPREYDNLGTIIAFHPRYDLSDNDDFTKEELIQHIKRKDILSLPVYVYEHSNIILSVDEFTCKWDSGQIGYIFASHQDIIKEYGSLDIESATKLLENEISEYSKYLNGECYGYFIYKKEKDCLNDYDSCFGFLGDDYIEKEVKSILKQLEGGK